MTSVVFGITPSNWLRIAFAVNSYLLSSTFLEPMDRRFRMDLPVVAFCATISEPVCASSYNRRYHLRFGSAESIAVCFLPLILNRYSKKLISPALHFAFLESLFISFNGYCAISGRMEESIRRVWVLIPTTYSMGAETPVCAFFTRKFTVIMRGFNVLSFWILDSSTSCADLILVS